jgi:hypothetical protein
VAAKLAVELAHAALAVEVLAAVPKALAVKLRHALLQPPPRVQQQQTLLPRARPRVQRQR